MKPLFSILTLSLGLAAGAPEYVTAQEQAVTQDALLWPRFDDIQRRNPWNDGLNAAGIRCDSVSRSYAELFGQKDFGGLTDYSASDDSWTVGARTESIRHFDKISFAGRFEYAYFDGRNMCGSMFSVPGYYPVDILEFTPGRKVREDYAFTGALSAVLGRHWTSGLRIDFEAGNYAKRKDLRHKNKRLDFEVAPGILYRHGRGAIGAAYIFGKNSERIEAEEIGTSADSYEAFFDKGLSYGVLERWDGSGIHLNETGLTGFPIKEMTHGASLQGAYGPCYVDVTYRHRNGESGEKDTFMHDFTTSEVTAQGIVTLPATHAVHTIRARFGWLTQENDEAILRRETINGIATVIDLGSLPIYARRRLEAGGEYELQTRRIDLRVGGAYERQNRRSTLHYPYVREQAMHVVSGYAKLRVLCKYWELSFDADFRKGGFSEEAFADETPLEPGPYPQQLTDCYDYRNEYLTAPRLGVGVGVRRNIHRFYIDLSGRYEHGFQLRFISRAHRTTVLLAVGYNF